MPLDYEVYAIRYGTRTTRRSDVFLHYEIYHEPDTGIDMDYYFWVVRAGGAITLVDCGFSDEGGARRSRTMLCHPVAALSRLGITPRDVGRIVASHAHYDHIGNLNAFPSAEVVISRREYDFWTGPIGHRALFAHSSERADIEELRRLRQAGRLTFVEDSHQVAEGLTVRVVGGHTPGQLVTSVDTGHGLVVLASDALHYYDEITRDWPFAHVSDLEATYRVLDALREYGAGTTVVAGHDPDVMRRYAALDGDAAGLGVRIA